MSTEAHEEARARYGTGPHAVSKRIGFEEGAEWQASRPVTDAEVEAAAKVLFAIEEPDRNAWRWNRPNPNTPGAPFAWHDYWLDAARAALEAARTTRQEGADRG